MKKKKIISLIICIVMLFSVSACKPNGGESYEFIEIWHYYNGAQKDIFDSLVKNFNETVGQRENIVVRSTAKGRINELGQAVLDSANKKVGSMPMPQLFMSYSDIAFEVEKLGLLSDYGQYFTQSELSEYYEPFLNEGKISDEKIKIFPTAKSTEVFMMNKTDWDKFATSYNAAFPQDTVSIEDLETFEGILEVAKKYHTYVNKPFFAIDSISNYLLAGAKQMGIDIFEVNLDKTASYNLPSAEMKRLWDMYYTPYLQGYYNCADKFGTGDIRIGNLLSCIGASSSCAFFPDKVFPTDETDAYDIETLILPAPIFQDGSTVQIQQGAGVCLTKSNAKTEAAAVKFMKWFTDTPQNLQYCLGTGYIPVKKQAQNIDTVNEFVKNSDTTFSPMNIDMMRVSFEILATRTMYYTKPFENGVEARQLLDDFKTKINQDKSTVNAISDKVLKAEKITEMTGTAAFEAWLNQLTTALNSL